MKLDTLDDDYSLPPVCLALVITQMFTVTANNSCCHYSDISLSFFSVSSSYDTFLLFIFIFIYFLQWWTLEKPFILKKSF